jgi:hypothetical protein
MKEQFSIGGKTIQVTDDTTRSFEGDIVITDPCYFISDSIWQKLCEIWFNEDGTASPYAEAGTIYIDGKPILYSSTAHGDGAYRVTGVPRVKHPEFGVDSGTMAIVSLEDFEALTNDKIQPGLHALVLDFDGNVCADEEGNFVGDLEVNTSAWGEDEDTYDDNEDDTWEEDNKSWNSYGDDEDDDY